MGTGEQQVEYQPVTGEVGARVSNQLWRKRQGLEFVGPYAQLVLSRERPYPMQGPIVDPQLSKLEHHTALQPTPPTFLEDKKEKI